MTAQRERERHNRPAHGEPGGCECLTCGVIFIGAPWHDECAVCADLQQEPRAVPECPYCSETDGLRKLHDGYGSEPPEYTCARCFTAMDDGPGFDDLEPAS